MEGKKTVVTLTWDHDAMALEVQSTEATVGFVQMIVDEAARYMDDERRKQAIERIKQSLAEQARVAALLGRNGAGIHS